MARNTLYLHLTGGLGNQMFQVAAALAQANGREIVQFSRAGKPRSTSLGEAEIFSFETIQGLSKGPRLNSENWFISKLLGYILRSGVSPKGFEKHPFFLKVIHGAFNFIMTIAMRERIKVFVADNVGKVATIDPKSNLLVGYFQSHYWPDQMNFKEIYKNSVYRNSPSYKEYELMARDKKVLAVHVRLGDYLNESSFGIPTKSYFTSAISYVRANTTVDQIWVFSDSPELVSNFLNLNLDLSVIVIPNEDKSSVEILEIMRLAHSYVIANSTFSWWGATLSINCSPIVVAPNPWFKSMASPKELVPPTWIRLESWPPR